MISHFNKLHLGSGSIHLEGWINIDLDSDAADQHLDLTKPLPFPSASATHVFSEHFIEHVTRENALDLLKECHRVLTPNGTIRITTPDLKFLVHSYLRNETGEWKDLWQPISRCSMLNEGMRSWGHQYLYDAEELARLLCEAGFKVINFRRYRKSEDNAFIGIESRPFNNELIVEAQKSLEHQPQINFTAASENEASWTSTARIEVSTAAQNMMKIEQESIARASHIEHLNRHVQTIEAENFRLNSMFLVRLHKQLLKSIKFRR